MRKVLALVSVAILLAVSVPLAGAQMDGPALHVDLTPTMYAADAGLAGVTGFAHVEPDAGYISITLEPNGAELPAGTVLEGWLVDEGLGTGMEMMDDMSGEDMASEDMAGDDMSGEDMASEDMAGDDMSGEDMGMADDSMSGDDMGMMGGSNASDADEVYGVAFDNAAFDAAVEAAPYALSTGVLTTAEDGTWTLTFEVPGYNFSPYDAVVVTLESDADAMDGFDPRPGTPVFEGAIASAMAAEQAMAGMMGMDDMMGMDMGMGHDVSLAVTPLAANAGLEGITGSATVYTDTGYVTISVNLNGAELPAGSVLEGWLVDAGLDGGPGTTHASDADEAFGVAFGNEEYKALVESAPYALSTGVLTAAEDGSLTLTFHIPAYNFSPYDAVVITLESDGDDAMMGFDPRPGTPVLEGAIDSMM